MTKRKDLKKRLNSENLLTTMSGGGVFAQASDTVVLSPGGSKSIQQIYGLANAANTNANSVKAVLGGGDTTIDPTGNDGLMYLAGYASTATPTAYNPTPTTANGIPAWIIDQLNAHAMNSTNTSTYVQLGKNVTIGTATFPNRLLTLQDFVGILSGSTLSLPADLQAAIDTGPIAQYKHLPAVGHLN